MPSSSRPISRWANGGRHDLVYEKEDLLIDGPGKYHEYDFYKVAGVSIRGKAAGEGIEDEPPSDIKDLLP